jgi:leucyl/phenylalanyl-tRNA--protein transferase
MFRSPTILGNDLKFPPPETADSEGMLAIGGDLSPERLLAAYKQGIFPWYEGDIPVWWNPDPRFVLFPKDIKISHSMKPILKKSVFQFTKNQCFEDVIRNCMQMPRVGQDGTWINEDVISAYAKLHKMGYVHSYEAWQNNTLVGGFYGMKLGKVFFGESMFSKVPNSSKAVFITSVLQMQKEGIQLIDSQVYTPHLESLGAGMIPRKTFLDLLRKLIPDE